MKYATTFLGDLCTFLGIIAGGITGYAGTYAAIYEPQNISIYIVWIVSCVTVPVGAIFGGILVYLTFKLFSVKPIKDADINRQPKGEND
jgi:hypothetical protein